jgi:hypothetical protein
MFAIKGNKYCEQRFPLFEQMLGTYETSKLSTLRDTAPNDEEFPRGLEHPVGAKSPCGTISPEEQSYPEG